MKFKIGFVVILGLTVLRFASSQAPSVPAAIAHSQGDPSKAMDALVSRFERDMTKAAESMPADKYNFTPASLHVPGASFAHVRSFADQVKHVTQANYAIAGNIVGSDPLVSVEAIDRLANRDEILAALAASFAAVHSAILTITPSNENSPVNDVGVGPNQTKESEAAWVAVHGYDHYGQMVEYLRLEGIVLKP